ncbi:MAG: hypothetical protein WDO71_28385 [Bacteroidota bacterium]
MFTKTIVIYKKKSIYERFWFYVAALVAFVLLVFLFIKIQTRNLNKKRIALQKRVDEQTAELSRAGEVKDLLISIISHDMIAPQKHVAMVAKALKTGFEKDPQKITEALSDIQTTSERIVAGSTTIINWMKYNNKKNKNK